MDLTLGIVLVAVFAFLSFIQLNRQGKKRRANAKMSEEWKSILTKEVDFYKKLNAVDKTQFEQDILQFLSRVRIVGVDTEIEDLDKLLIASGAVIPIFHFKSWMYPNLTEVVVYPAAFNTQFEIEGAGRFITGMVGSGILNGKVLLSKKSVRNGFSNISDKKNVVVHEFIHLIDGLDGTIDGVPKILLENQEVIPWIELMKQKMKAINAGKTNINTYGGVAGEEFFAVISEYFFERPELLKKKHPKLYDQLNEMFKD